MTAIEPAKQAELTAIPSDFLNEIASYISTLDELQVSLAFFRLLDGEIGDAVELNTLIGDEKLQDALKMDGNPRLPSDRIRTGVERALKRGTFIATYHTEGDPIQLYFASLENQQRLAAGELGTPFGGIPQLDSTSAVAETGQVFRAYEEQIGPLTPLAVDRIVAATQSYSIDDIAKAMDEAVQNGKRSWRYIESILASWSASGQTTMPREGTQNEAYTRIIQSLHDMEQYRDGKHLRRVRRSTVSDL